MKRFEKYEAEGLTPEQMEEKEAQRRKRARSKSRQRKEAQLESKGIDFNYFLFFGNLRNYQENIRGLGRFLAQFRKFPWLEEGKHDLE